jgi:tol-pal system protein YbgF
MSRPFRFFVFALSAVAAGSLAPLAAVAEDAVSQEPTQAAPSTPSSDRRLSELFYQLQVLQQEVQTLRGLVEEQTYQLNRLARDQKEQYIDLDRRIAGLPTTGNGGVSTGAGAGVPAGTSPGLTAPATATAAASAAGTASSVPSTATGAAPVVALPGSTAGMSERETYQQAFDLMKGRQFDASIASFNRLIVDYPNGQYTPNAFYWLGELYLAQQNTEQARQSFMQVVNLYPDHPKVPDTLYKLGVAYHRLGDSARAAEYFDQVQNRFPQSSAAGLALSYAQEIQ